METNGWSAEFAGSRWDDVRLGLKENSGLAIHIKGLCVHHSREDGRCQNGGGDRTIPCEYAIDSHVLILIEYAGRGLSARLAGNDLLVNGRD